METVEEERQGGRLVLNYTHRILPGVTQLENYGQVSYMLSSRLSCHADSFFFCPLPHFSVYLCMPVLWLSSK